MAVLSKATWIGIAVIVAAPIVFCMWACWLTAKAQQDDLSPEKEKVSSA